MTVFVISHMMLVELRIFLQERLGALIQTATVEPILAVQHCKIRSNSSAVAHMTC